MTARSVRTGHLPLDLELTRTELWANEEILQNSRVDRFRLPSDIKAGVYVLRTELLALHGNTPAGAANPVNGRGPQFYTHCFTLNVTGRGNVEPQGVKFPSPAAYKRLDPGVKFILFSNKETWKDYVSK
jgi:cellulase